VRKALAVALILVPLAASAADVKIIQKGRRFSPTELVLKAGDSITFTNDDEFIHQMYVDGLFDSDERKPGQTLTEQFPRSGTFEVRCHIHPKMKLVVRVN
jgi:plastocyanin